jgi:pyruvate dehydrogenase E1 component beta subunit
MTGVAIGSAVTGMRPILTHQRLDFALVSIDQIVNQAAKWHYMFNGSMNAPLVIRMIIGRGWGQGPQHSQSLHAWFAHIPGLKVIMPSTPFDAKGMLISAVEDENPVLLLEHRWLHSIKGHVPEGYYTLPLEGCSRIAEGNDITLVSLGYGINECRAASVELKKYNISAELIDIRCVHPIDCKSIVESVAKTGRIMVVDHAENSCGIASEIIARIAEGSNANDLLTRPTRLTFPNHPCPTSPALSKDYYIKASNIVVSALKQFNRHHEFRPLSDLETFSHDQPNPSYIGPF